MFTMGIGCWKSCYTYKISKDDVKYAGAICCSLQQTLEASDAGLPQEFECTSEDTLLTVYLALT